MKITAKDLFNAIESNSIEVVKAYIELGGDPNVDMGEVRWFQWYDFKTVRKNDPTSDYFVAIGRSSTYDSSFNLKALHIAVVNCFRNLKAAAGNEWETSVDLLDTLLGAGTVGTILSNLVLVDKSDQAFTTPDEDYTPLSLALVLRGFITQSSDTNLRVRFDMVITKLVSSLTASSPGLKPPLSISVPKSVVDTYKNLLDSSKGSDIKFVCEDGQEFPAHRIILAAASPYFATAFEGPWAESTSDGEWTTSHPAHIIKAVLAFVYTGDLKASLVETNPMEMLSIAGEYDIASLKTVATVYCVATVDDENFTEMLQLAHLHQIEDLKKACFEYAKRNSARLLTNANIISNLPTEDPDLWAEFTAAVGPGGK